MSESPFNTVPPIPGLSVFGHKPTFRAGMKYVMADTYPPLHTSYHISKGDGLYAGAEVYRGDLMLREFIVKPNLMMYVLPHAVMFPAGKADMYDETTHLHARSCLDLMWSLNELRRIIPRRVVGAAGLIVVTQGYAPKDETGRDKINQSLASVFRFVDHHVRPDSNIHVVETLLNGIDLARDMVSSAYDRSGTE